VSLDFSLIRTNIKSRRIDVDQSDRWIKRMSRAQNLINPFEEKLIRTVDDHRIISLRAVELWL